LAAEADDRYMGYANRDELLAFLNELLEAERAGARLAIRMSISAVDFGTRCPATVIYRDEAHWCGVLAKAIRDLDAIPSNRVGASYG
jgi:hypothetical protein